MRRLYAAAIGSLVFVVGAGEPSLAVERATYSVVLSNPPYEIREYPSTLTATVAIDGSRSEAVNSGFRLLADYIFGENQQKSRIAMTAPVTQRPSASAVATLKNTAQYAPSPTSWTIRFTMPAGYTLQTLPIPTDTRVQVEQFPAHRVAALGFSGFWSDGNLKSHEQQLLQWMQSQHLMPQSSATFAYYDPPWTPWFMRTTEVLIDIAPMP